MYKLFRKQDGRLAQLEEHLVYTERVGSSNLSAPTIKNPPKGGFFLYFERQFRRQIQAFRPGRQACVTFGLSKHRPQQLMPLASAGESL